MQQRLGRNAAHMQAGAAQLGVFFDDGGLQAVLAGAHRCRVAAGAATNHNQVVCHVTSFYMEGNRILTANGIAAASGLKLGEQRRYRRLRCRPRPPAGHRLLRNRGLSLQSSRKRLRLRMSLSRFRRCSPSTTDRRSKRCPSRCRGNQRLAEGKRPLVHGAHPRHPAGTRPDLPRN
jgi:hypothetical protein